MESDSAMTLGLLREGGTLAVVVGVDWITDRQGSSLTSLEPEATDTLGMNSVASGSRT